MEPHGMQRIIEKAQTPTHLRRMLGFMSVATMLMTITQVLTIWVGDQAAGVSVLSWGAYLASALLWFWYALEQRDRSIYVPGVGWIALDPRGDCRCSWPTASGPSQKSLYRSTGSPSPRLQDNL